MCSRAVCLLLLASCCVVADPGRFLLRLLADTAGACARGDDWGECLVQRGRWWAERALRVRSLPLAEGLALVRTARQHNDSRDPISRMLGAFSLQVDAPAALSDPEGLAKAVEEGRGKLKKYWKPLMLIVTAIKAYLFFTALAALAVFIVKALLVSKVALVLALTALYKKYFGGGKKETIEVIKVQQHQAHHHSSEGSYHQQEYSSSSEWEGGSAGGYSSSSGAGASDGGGGGYGGDEYGSYDKRRVDAPSEGGALAYRGHNRRHGGPGPPTRWSPREEGEEGAVGGREERSVGRCLGRGGCPGR